MEEENVRPSGAPMTDTPASADVREPNVNEIIREAVNTIWDEAGCGALTEQCLEDNVARAVFAARAQSNARPASADVIEGMREALLTDGIRNLCYTAFQRRASGRNSDDGGECDWMNDTLPLIERGIANLLRTVLALPDSPTTHKGGK